MRSARDARASWELLEQAKSLADLRAAVGLGSAPATLVGGQRSACWKAFLLFENVDHAEWPSTLAESRSVYDSLRAHFLRAIENPDELESALDPLSENDESPWVGLRKDEALRAEIFQDVDRCMPDNTYFRHPDTQRMLLDILFIFCKLNPDVGYKQGMHEVLAPILWVVERDAVDPKEAGVNNRTHHKDLLLDMCDSRFIEHDTFTLFGLVMQNAKAYYEPSRTSQSSDSPMLVKCRHIFERLLPKADPELADHLKEIEVAPQMFLMRWMRLLFGREFPFDDVLPMWDLMFAADPSLEIADYVCVAMLLRVRWELLDADANMAITILLRYPQPRKDDPPRTYVQDAVQLSEKLNWETASQIVKNYTGRVPARPQQRPETPQEQTSPQRQLSPFKFHAQSMSPSGSIETIIQDAARGIHKTGEKWGVNKTIRDAVGDFRKNVQGIQSGRNAPTFRSLITGEANKATDSTALLSKIEYLEERNKSLARMLEESVSELWECQKDALDGKGSEKKAIESLSLAIAKVQVMQVYLEDYSIPLPADDPAPFEESPPKSTLAEVSEEPSVPSSEDASMTIAPTSDKPAPAPTSRKSTPTTAPHSATINSRPASIASPTESASSSQTLARNFSPGSRTRPTLASSSFSWMLGGQEPDATTPASSFAAASQLSTFQPLEKRERRRNKPTGGGGGAAGKRGASGGSGGNAYSGEAGGGGGDDDGDKSFLFGDDEFMSGPMGPGSTASKRATKKGKDTVLLREVFDLDEVGGGAGAGAGAGRNVGSEAGGGGGGGGGVKVKAGGGE
ncbi:tbc domain-containing protein [Diplodia corticola]|uniref:Tbc domain-containing protein n=1 Tax=Diplodia corticola TaxID=236234 RepID=A0A1J9S766_9PEZI|nr:tbc domain-containing protein [Diplodia corticola]OJD36351.1 tbc domain-containing protein [Diplodia corticola]